MVTFSCDLCADVIKKPKASQHIYRCPDAQFTCIDCFTTFQGDSYLSHTSCISEAEKYQKGLYKGNKKGKQDTPNRQKQQKCDTPNRPLKSREQFSTFNNNNNNNKDLKNSEQDQTLNTITDNNNHSQESNSKKKKKNKNKKIQKQVNQPNEKIINITVKNYNHEGQETLDTNINQEDNNTFVNSSPRKKKKNKNSSVYNINGVDDKVKDSDNIVDSNETQSVQTCGANETPKKTSNIGNLDSSSKKKKKKGKNDSLNNNGNNNLEDTNGARAINHKTNKKGSQSFESSVGILKKETSDENKKRKSVEFMLPESPTKNKKQKTNESSRNDENLKFGTHNLSNYYESIPAVVKEIFKSNSHKELNLKRLEEMVVHQLISGSDSSESELKEKFLENIVLTMKDGNIILK